MDANSRTALKLGGVALAMFGFGYALVPMYNAVCKVTGLNGRTGDISAAQAAAIAPEPGRTLTVEFDTNVNGTLPWLFQPLQHSVQVHPGELTTVRFVAENDSDETVVGQAVPNLAPAKASPFFSKTECFCFSQQTLAPRERREMPVKFIIDPKVPPEVDTLTLSYTFFEVPDSLRKGAAAPAGNNTKQSS